MNSNDLRPSIFYRRLPVQSLCGSPFVLNEEEPERPSKEVIFTGSGLEDAEPIPACPDCQGDGCKKCFGTGLTAEDCDFEGLARARSQPMVAEPQDFLGQDERVASEPRGSDSPETE